MIREIISLKVLLLFLLTIGLFANNATAQNQVAYLRSTVGTPWGSTNNEIMMDTVFGVGNWDDLRYETVDVPNLLSSHSMLFFEGSSSLANELETFLNNNQGSIENWVLNGGNIFINSGPGEGNGMNFGFGGTTLVVGTNLPSMNALETNHPIFNGPYLPVGTAWTGNSITHGFIQGTDLIDLAGSGGFVTLAMKNWGAGKVVFGTMTTVNFHQPDPEATNLRQNILDYLKGSPVPIDAGIVGLEAPTIFCAGNYDIIVQLANLGLDTLTSVVVNWEFDGVAESPSSYNGTLDTIGSGNNIINFTLGNKNFATAEEHSLKVWTSMPNGVQDTVNVNDTLVVNLGAGLNGSYTIGGNAPDYSTISNAVTDLENYGICGPVTFNIRSGLYNEQIRLTEIVGASPTNNVTFQSETGDSSSVIIEFSPTSNATDYVWYLDGADFITLRGLTFKSLGTSYDYGLVFGNNANNNIIENNYFDGNNQYGYLIYSPNTQDENNTIRNNYFQDGRHAIYFFGASSTKEDGNVFQNNILENQYSEAMYIQYQENLVLEENMVENFNNSATSSAIRLYDCDGLLQVRRNEIRSCCRYYGLYIESSTGVLGNEGVIANNFIALLRTTGTAYGIYSSSCNYQKYYHNTINLQSSDINYSRAFYHYYNSNIDIRNNIFANKGGGYAMYSNSTSGITTSNNNDLYTTGENLGYWGGNQGTLADWQSASGLDGSSISIDPFFESDSTFAVIQISLNGAGQSLADVSIDIEGEVRDVSNPDIGADEFTPAPDDAGVLSITVPEAPFLAGSHPVYGVLKNYGGNTLSSVNLDWEVNNVAQSTVNWTGALASGDTLSVLLGNVNFQETIGYTIDASTDLPNGTADSGITNDSTSISNIYAALGGIYTLGGATPDFNDFATAQDALNYGGVYDAVTINIRDGIYNEQVHLNEILEADASNHITFQSESGDSTAVVLQFSPTNNDEDFLWYLDGSDYITIRGLTFKILGTSYDYGLLLNNNANNNTIENNYFEGNGQYGYMVYSNMSEDENNIIQNNHFQDGRYGVYILGVNATREDGNIIQGNTFKEQFREAVYVQYQTGILIKNNLVENFINNSSYSGIILSQCDGLTEVLENSITSSSRQYGLQINNCNSTSGNEGLVANNYISLLRPTGTAYGVRSYYSNYIKYYHNTVHVLSSDANYSRSFDDYYGSNIDLRNNIFSNQGGGYTIYTITNSAISTSDNNDLYATGTNIGFWNGQSYATFADWQSNTGLDANSISIDPFFETDTSYVIAQISLDAAGQPLAEVTTDIEGNARDLVNPDIGAYIFSPAMLDAGVINLELPTAPFPVGEHMVTAVLKNFGTEALTSATLDWEINGVAQTSVNWTGNLPTGDTILVDLNLVDFELGLPYSFRTWTDSPNGGNDLVNINDTTSVNDVYAGIGGSYTLGGTTPDFTDFEMAETVLNYGGVYAPVDIQVRDGVYSEQLELVEILGANSLNQVVFESENNDASLVTLSYLTSGSSNHVVRLDGTDWLTIKDMTIETESSSISSIKVIDIRNGATHNTFEGNHIIGGTTTYSGNSRAVIYIPSTGVNEYNGFVNNTIENGSAGIQIEGNYNSAAYTKGNYITGNTFVNQYYYGLYLASYQTDVLVADNEITSNTNYTSYYGIYINNLTDNISILRNRITEVTGYGMYININATTSTQCLIANNFIQLDGTTTSYGIYSYYGSFQNIYHNTISMLNTNPDSRCFYNYYGNNKRIKNNIFSNTGGGYAYYIISTSGILESDYNDLYATGSYIAYFGGQLATLADWQSSTNFDDNSVSIDPLFVSDTDLHVTNVLLDKKGTATGIATDIDGDTRDATFPDIGADEFSTTEYDAGVYSIDSPVMPFAADIQEIYITLVNNGLDTLENVQLDWYVNNQAQLPVSWSGSLLPGEQEDSVLLGSFTFELDTLYNITAWTSNPNGEIDTETYNDTLVLDSLYAALAGIYTIGGTTPDYQDFTEAVTAMDRGGVIGEVVFDVRAGTYNEQVVITEILGANSDHTITFRSENADSAQVILTYDESTSADNYVLKLDAADWLRFHQITIQSEGVSSYERVIHLENGANNNIFSNNAITGRDIGSTGSGYMVIYDIGNTPNNNNAFLNNKISGGSYGMYAVSGTTSNYNTGNTISGNTFEHQYYRGIYHIESTNLTVDDNYVTTNKLYSGYEAMHIYNCLGGINITNNTIIDLPRGDGMLLSYLNGTPVNPNLIANNFIQTGIGGYTLYGINFNNNYYTDIYHNNIHITSTSTSSAALYTGNGGNNNVQNNILVNTGGGYAFYNSNSAAISDSDYNDLYATGTNLGRWNNVNITDLSSWQIASGQDANSFSIDPIFAANNDLHISEIDLNDAGTPLAVVSTDIDGEPRSPTNPDIGADEFSPATTNDVSLESIISPNHQTPFPVGDNDIVAVIKNNGIDTVETATINLLFNNIVQPNYSWTGFLEPGERDTVIIGSGNFGLGVANSILAYTSMPDGVMDAIPENDTTSVTDLYAGLIGIYTVGGQLPDFFNLAEAVNTLNNGGVLGAVDFMIRNGTYAEQLSIETVKGGTAATPVVFQSESQDSSTVIISTNASPTLRLNGADYITFQQVTFGNTNYSGILVELNNEAHNNQFLNNHFIERLNYGSSVHIYSPNTQNNNNRIEGNLFQGGGYGLQLSGVNNTYKETGTIIRNNIFENQSYRSIYLYYFDAPEIRDNTIITDYASSSYIGLYARYTDNATQIIANKIYANTGQGLQLYLCDGTQAEKIAIHNNFIGIEGTDANYGVSVYSSTHINFYNNSIRLGSTNTSSRCFYSNGGSNNSVLNNILSNQGGGYAIHIPNSSSLLNSDYNNLHTTGAALGSWSNTDIADLATWQASTGRDINSLSVDPLYIAPRDLHTVQILLDSAGIGVAGIIQDIDADPRDPSYPDIGADEINFLPDDVGITEFVSPVSGCGLGNNIPVTIKIQNFSSTPLSGFDVAYIADGQAPVIENIGAVIVPPGLSVDYTFGTTLDLTTAGNYDFIAYTNYANDNNSGNDSTTIAIENIDMGNAVTGMVPTDGATDLPRAITFSWAPVNGATSYDLYVWEQGQTIPNSPTISGITQISYYLGYGNFNYGQSYNWTIVASNPYCETIGTTQSFTIEFLPDLTVQNVQIPANSFSGQNLSVSWQIENNGSGGTNMQQWTDAVYLSDDQILNLSTDIYLGGVSNFTALETGESYNSTADFTLPNGIQGNYYVFIVTDRYNNIPEEDNGNNTGLSISSTFVDLTPPPDLQVTSIIPLNTVFSGQAVDIIYTVENAGTGQTRSPGWIDRFYFSESTTFDLANSTYLGQMSYSENMLPDSSYTQTLATNIPEAISGTYYVYVLTDYYNNEYEHANEANNTTRSASITVILTPPPDLAVTDITIPASVSVNDVANVQWTVENQGGTAAGPTNWNDRIYLSANPSETDLSNAIYLGQSYYTATLNPTETYTGTRNVTIPGNIQGDYYIYIHTDYSDNIFEYLNESNNIQRSAGVINIRTPDLEVSNINAPATAQSGEAITISWTDTNIGLGTLFPNWKDKVFISTNSTYTPGTLTELGMVNNTANLSANDSQNNQGTFTLPNGISGQYYVYVFADEEDAVFENGLESNNVNTNGISLQIALTPWVDVTPTALQIPATTAAGATMAVEYSIENQGAADLTGTSWTDKLYISSSATWNPASAQLLRTLQYANTLESDSSYTVETTVNIPINLVTNNYYLHLITDADNDIYEYTDENNNQTASAAFTVTGYPAIDLAVTSVTTAETASSGQDITVQWEVENLSAYNTVAAYWFDAVYISTDTIWNPDTDQELGQWQRSGPLNAGDTYSTSQTVSIPNGISGTYYLLAVTDYNELNNDFNRDNNYDVARDDQGASQETEVELTPPADLVISSFNAPPNGLSGQPLAVTWTVENNGTGPTTSGAWVDRFYLSTDFVLDAGDQWIKTVNHSGNLAVGDSYSGSEDVQIPINVFGNRILIVKTDYNDSEYEYTNEGNNTATSVISITQPPPSDLVVTDISVPAMAIAGESVTIEWKISNTGSNPATGVMKEAVYLSTDETWDINDVLMGVVDGNINLAPLAEEDRTLTTDLAGVTLGDYHAIVRTDILNNIYESDDNNNTSASTNTLNINVNELVIDVLTPNVLVDENNMYYRIEIPEALAGESLLVTLKGDSINGANELYLRYGEIASRVNYDYGYSVPYYGNQEIIIPELQAGTYYVLAYGSTTSGNSQNVTLLAEILNFEIRNVAADEGGNTGFITLEIEGAKFDSLMNLRLLGQGMSLLAESVHYIDPTVVFATFDLRGMPIGLYDVIAEKQGGETAVKPESFTIIQGNPPSLSTNIIHPSATRPNRTESIRLEYTNNGNVDIRNPVVVLKSLAEAHTSLTVEGLNDELVQLDLELTEANGPPDILRPGASGSITIYVKANNPLGFIVVIPDFD